MPTEILMPKLPYGEEGRIARWLVREGEHVEAGDVIAEIETASATLEIEVSGKGSISRILVPAGKSPVRESTPLALVDPVMGRAPETQGERRSLTDAPTSLGHTGESPGAAAHARLLTYRQALRLALAEEMRRDPSVLVIGYDVRQNSGAADATQGLAEEFGEERVISVPGMETAVSGIAAGAAYRGLRPVVVFQSWARAVHALAMIVHEAAHMKRLSGGSLDVPIVLRAPNGYAPSSGTLDGQCLSAWLAHVPGLKVVAPATPAAARGLMKAAIRDPGPVAVLESERLYDLEGLVSGDADDVMPLGRAEIAREGEDVTVVAYGPAVPTAITAAAGLKAKGIGAEVVDLLSLRPLDLGTVLQSVRKTGRIVTVEEGWPQGSVGSELLAGVASLALSCLRAPPRRLCGADAPVFATQPPGEPARPGVDEVMAAVAAVLQDD